VRLIKKVSRSTVVGSKRQDAQSDVSRRIARKIAVRNGAFLNI